MRIETDSGGIRKHQSRILYSFHILVLLVFYSCFSTPAFIQNFHFFPTQLLHPLATALRYEGDEVNTMWAKGEAKILREKITEKAYYDDEVIRILSTRSKAQLNATFNIYNNSYGNAISKVQN